MLLIRAVPIMRTSSQIASVTRFDLPEVPQARLHQSNCTHGGQAPLRPASGGLPTLRAQLVGVLATGGPPLSGGGIEPSEKRPGIPRPSGVEQRVVPGAQLVG